MPSDRPKKPHGTFTPAATISRVLTRAGHPKYVTRKDTAFGGHRCSWSQEQGLVWVRHRPGDEVMDEAERKAEIEEMLGEYEQTLRGEGYRVERRSGLLYANPVKESAPTNVPRETKE